MSTEHEITVVCPVSFRRMESGRKRIQPKRAQAAAEQERAGIPRISKLMALAIRFDWLIRTGTLENLADLARLGGVSYSRVTQIMNLLNLAPEIQEELLFLRRAPEGHDAFGEYDLRGLCSEIGWGEQREMWRSIRSQYT